ncbi:MAG: GNAT family protein [Pseudomonadota bacterium]
MTRLETERLVLRSARSTDLDQLHLVLSDVRAMRYWDTPAHSDITETEEFLSRMISTPIESGEEFVALLRGKVIGKVGFWRFPEIGFIVHPSFWGQGLGREAVSAVVAHGFHTHNLPEITADVDPRNASSIRLLEALGFVETGRETATINVGGEWCDSIYLSRKNSRV